MNEMHIIFVENICQIITQADTLINCCSNVLIQKSVFI